MLSRIESKVLVHKGVLGGRGKEVFLLVITVFDFVGGDVGEDFKVVGGSGGDGGTGNDVHRGIWDVEEGIVLRVVKSGPDKFWRWGARRGSDGGRRTESVGTGAGIVPGVEVRVENLKDGGGGVSDVLLVDVIKGRPGSDRDLGKGGCRGRSP